MRRGHWLNRMPRTSALTDAPNHSLTRALFTADAGALVLLIAIFLGGRAVYYAIGIRFQAQHFDGFWQFLDAELLRTRLLESVWYLHTQPPIFNLFVGLLVKVAPSHLFVVWHLIYLLCGAGTVALMYRLMRRLDVDRRIALGCAGAFALLPQGVLMENHPLYDYPVAFVMVAATLCLARFTERDRLRDAAGFAGLIVLAALTRSAFHLAWVIAVGAGLVVVARTSRRRVALIAVASVVVVGGLYGKNVLLMGLFGATSWVGPGLAKMTTFQLSEDERRELVRAGVLSRWALVPPYSDLLSGDASGPPPPHLPDPLPPALSASRKLSGALNHNDYRFLAASHGYVRDAFTTLRRDPAPYLRVVVHNIGVYFQPVSAYWGLADNVTRLGRLNQGVNIVLSGSLLGVGRLERLPETARALLMVGWFTVAAHLAALILAMALAWAAIRRPPPERDRVHLVTVGFVAFNVLYMVAVGNLFETGESNRYRYLIEPLVVVALAACLDRIVRGGALRSLPGP